MLERARRLISEAGTVVSFSGAGLSAESGLSTFRDADGLWARYDPAVYASVAGFERDPGAITEWYQMRRRSFASATPNPAHRALAAAPIIHVTQNIDTLLEQAGAADVVHLHGVIDRDRCHANCGHREVVAATDPPPLRPCPDCGAHMRPDVVWFGELLPEDAWQRANLALQAADVILVVGTSVEVWPAAGLIHSAADAGAHLIVVNTEPGTTRGLGAVDLVGPAGEILPRLLD